LGWQENIETSTLQNGKYMQEKVVDWCAKTNYINKV